jgi:hypothetical protein
VGVELLCAIIRNQGSVVILGQPSVIKALAVHVSLGSVKGATMRRGLVVFVPLLFLDDDLSFSIVLLLVLVFSIVVKGTLTKLGGVSVTEFDGVALGGSSAALLGLGLGASATWDRGIVRGDGDGDRTSRSASGCAFIIFDERGDVEAIIFVVFVPTWLRTWLLDGARRRPSRLARLVSRSRTGVRVRRGGGRRGNVDLAIGLAQADDWEGRTSDSQMAHHHGRDRTRRSFSSGECW